MTEYRIIERGGKFRAQYRGLWKWWPLGLTSWHTALEPGGHEDANFQPAEWDSYEKAEKAMVKMLAGEKAQARKWVEVMGAETP